LAQTIASSNVRASAKIGKPRIFADYSDECEMASSSGLFLSGMLERSADGKSPGAQARPHGAETFCMAGVGGDVPHVSKLTQSGRPIVGFDRCPLEWAKSHLARHGLEADLHHVLSANGVRKCCHADFDPQQAEALLTKSLPDGRTLCGNSEVPARFASLELGADETWRDRS
jgi:hypothetical protein